jgi:hypothetical protein
MEAGVSDRVRSLSAIISLGVRVFPELTRSPLPFLGLALATVAAMEYLWWSRFWFINQEAPGLTR